ncbi:hypothetical protein ONZ45_g18753 [Pleurotus djamor]|nr:hypothetical protein ONZ45_g18753 [Pleurotus djamor]
MEWTTDENLAYAFNMPYDKMFAYLKDLADKEFKATRKELKDIFSSKPSGGSGSRRSNRTRSNPNHGQSSHPRSNEQQRHHPYSGRPSPVFPGRQDALLESYATAWSQLKDGSHPKGIRVADFPWPVFIAIKEDDDPEKVITLARVKEFVLHPQRLQTESAKVVIRRELKFFHDDKFRMYLPFIAEDAREACEKVRAEVARRLTDLLAEVSN